MNRLNFEAQQDGSGYLEWIYDNPVDGYFLTPAVGRVKLTNDFHNTSCIVIPKKGKLTRRQIRKAWKTLCGMKNCCCSNGIGVR